MTDPFVIKIGGSLLATPGAMARVASLLAATRREGQTRLLLAGGGPVVEGLRAVDRANPLPESASHWAAIAMMDANTRLLASWLPGVCWHDLEKGVPEASGDYAVGVEAWLRGRESRLPGQRLADGWATTSDAISARLAACLEASLLVVKNESVGVYGNLREAADAGVVDEECPRVASSLPTVCVAGLPRLLAAPTNKAFFGIFA